jgi:hypothetical protein
MSPSSFSPAPYRRLAPTGGCIYKKLFELVFPFANISLKRDLNAAEKGRFLLQYVLFSQKKKIDGSIRGEKDTIDRKFRSAEPRRLRPCFDYYDRSRLDVGALSDWIQNFAKSGPSHPDLGASCLY